MRKEAKPASWQMTPPRPYKKQVDMFGKIIIGFSYPIYVSTNITMIGNGKITRSQLLK